MMRKRVVGDRERERARERGGKKTVEGRKTQSGKMKRRNSKLTCCEVGKRERRK